MSSSAISRTWPRGLGNSASHSARMPRPTSVWSSVVSSSRRARGGSPCQRWSRRRCSRAPGSRTSPGRFPSIQATSPTPVALPRRRGRRCGSSSTPAMAAAEHLAGVTEARPGNYVFYDRTMVLIGCCEPADVGVTVLATVVSHQPGAAHFIVDAGALELSKDPGPAHVASQAMGAVRGAPELTVATLSQEHGLIRADSPAALDGRFTVGTQVEIVPNHSCLTVPLFDEYHVIRGTGDGAREVDRWKVERGR